MVFTKDGLLRLLITIAISVVICVLVISVFFEEPVSLNMIIKCVVLGSIIWFVSEIALDLVDRLWPHNILPSYIILSLIIIFGTTAGLILFEFEPVGLIVLVDAVSVLCGLTIAIVYRRRYRERLNRQLEEYKEKE